MTVNTIQPEPYGVVLCTDRHCGVSALEDDLYKTETLTPKQSRHCEESFLADVVLHPEMAQSNPPPSLPLCDLFA